MANPEHVEILKQGVTVWNAWREEHPEARPLLNEEDLSELNLSFANLRSANLSFANLTSTSLRRACLESANLWHTRLHHADLSISDLSVALFQDAKLHQTRFHHALFSRTIFVDVDLSTAQGLETVRHMAPSHIGIDTIYHSQGNISERFLRGAGIPDPFITRHAIAPEAAQSAILSGVAARVCLVSRCCSHGIKGGSLSS
ncbi:pentapeptide repeat-containing protein [Ktedonospora formicarum]|uniref:pentapeptide repeat-containing protein n=1 Tax=Ktedonospora formicarum TaxID=2778364 RepID=UPI001C689CFA|nr:pentapeptide repeat-containing protein [Ktedonospora formicarum]